MITKCVVPGEIDCKYIDQCKDYKKTIELTIYWRTEERLYK